jgi:hypothetical protein
MDDIDEVSHKIKGLVTHKIVAKTKDIKQALFESCILVRYSDQKLDKTNPMACMTYIQKAMQYQYLRLIKQYPEDALKLIYDANCCPCGWVLKPSTQVCNLPDVCPWCYIRRRLYPAYNALTKDVDPEKYGLLCFPYGQKFYTGRNHPHYWFKAKVTVQIEPPNLKLLLPDHSHRVVLLSVVPKEVPVELKMKELYPRGYKYAVVDHTQENILKYLSYAVIDYSMMYHPTGLYMFEANQRHLNVSKYRKLRINRERNSNGAN